MENFYLIKWNGFSNAEDRLLAICSKTNDNEDYEQKKIKTIDFISFL
jgi:hypothetical protein